MLKAVKLCAHLLIIFAQLDCMIYTFFSDANEILGHF